MVGYASFLKGHIIILSKPSVCGFIIWSCYLDYFLYLIFFNSLVLQAGYFREKYEKYCKLENRAYLEKSKRVTPI